MAWYSNLPLFQISTGATGRKQRQATDFTSRLPQGWQRNLALGDLELISREKDLYVSKDKLSANLRQWYHPPQVNVLSQAVPKAETYFLRRLCVWMPMRMWRVEFKCPTCNSQRQLCSKGAYNRIRLVLDSKDFYYLAGESMYCSAYRGVFLSWDSRMLAQLADGIRSRFPAILTHKYACDISVVTLFRACTLGNSPHALCNNILEVHSEEWLRKQLQYLSDCTRHKEGQQYRARPPVVYEEAPKFHCPPTYQWFLAVYIRDVWNRLPLLKAAATSVFGSVLKIDSTKKVCRKLQGAATDTAAWVTNVGNERGEVLASVLTQLEGLADLGPLAKGLMDRYKRAGQESPRVLYTDRDCCALGPAGVSKYHTLFSRWQGLAIRLDVWHFMRRLSGGCTSESHPLYGPVHGQVVSLHFRVGCGGLRTPCSGQEGRDGGGWPAEPLGEHRV